MQRKPTIDQNTLNLSMHYNNLGVEYYQDDRLDGDDLIDDAIEQFTLALNLNPNFIEAYCNRGLAKFEKTQRLESPYFNQNIYSASIADFKAAIEIDPQNPTCFIAHRGLALVYEATKHLAEALHHYNEALKLNPNSAKTRLFLKDLVNKTSKSDLFHVITTHLPPEKQIPLLRVCLDKKTVLGARMWKTEFPYTGCDPKRGTLTKINAQLERLTAQSIAKPPLPLRRVI